MTGEQLYELSSMGYRHDPFSELPVALQEFYNEQANYRRKIKEEEPMDLFPLMDLE